MPFAGYSVGRDFVIDVYDPNGGGVVNLTGITDFQSAQKTTKQSSKRMDGLNIPLHVPDGWSGSFGIDRTGATIDNFIANLEDAYFRGSNILSGTITETISEPDGGRSQFRYENVSFTFTSAGDKKGDDKVSMKVDFDAARRRKIL